jgi:four helix bundle protein
MARTNFENLKVYQLSEKVADKVWEVVGKWPHFAKNTVGSQLVKAADSIGANIAEGTGRGSSKDNHRFICIARGSLYETHHWLRRAYTRRLLTKDQIAALRPMLDNLGPLLNGYLRSISRKHRAKP